MSVEQRNSVLAMWPDSPVRSGSDMMHPDFDKLKSNDDFRNDVTRYQDELKSGQHETQWTTQAIIANQERSAGVYEPYLADSFESAWGEEMPASATFTAKPQESSLDAKNSTNEETATGDTAKAVTLDAAPADVAPSDTAPTSATSGAHAGSDSTSVNVAFVGNADTDTSAAEPAGHMNLDSEHDIKE
jgi:hypothetical protein